MLSSPFNIFEPHLRSTTPFPFWHWYRTMGEITVVRIFNFTFVRLESFTNRALLGVVERANNTLCDCLCCCILGASVPKSFWADALCHIFFVNNSVPCSTPAGMYSPNSINGAPLVEAKYLHPFGCLVWHKVPEANQKNLDQKWCAAILLSYL